MMLLMVIFMITAPMMQGGVDIALPKAQARPLESKSGLVVTRRSRRAPSTSTTNELSLAEFRVELQGARGATREWRRLSARRRGVPYGSVVQVLAIMRAAGVGDVGLVAEPETVHR